MSIISCDFNFTGLKIKLISSALKKSTMVFDRRLLHQILRHVVFWWFCTSFVLAIPVDIQPSRNVDLQQQANVTFTLYATDMSGCDSNSACDLYVVINCESSISDWQQCGQTSKIQDDNFPVWPEVFTFDHFPGTSQRWRFDLIDVDVAFDDLISSFELNMDEYVNASGNLFQVPVPDNTGVFWIHRRR